MNKLVVDDIELITIKERREEVILLPLLQSLKIISKSSFAANPVLTTKLIGNTIANYNEDIVSDDLDSIVALLNLAKETNNQELINQVKECITNTVNKHVLN